MSQTIQKEMTIFTNPPVKKQGMFDSELLMPAIADSFRKLSPATQAVSYTHLTLPTICSV